MEKIKGIIFDLDDTLFDSTGQNFKKALFSAVTEMKSLGLKHDIDTVVNDLIANVMADPGINKFNYIKEKYALTEDICEAGIKAYYNFQFDKIELFPGAEDLLNELSLRYTTGLITFGNQEVQNRKIEFLGLNKIFKHIIISPEDKYTSFVNMINLLGIKQNRILVVGDRIDSELKVGKKLGMQTVRLLKGKYKGLSPQNSFETPDYVINRIQDLREILSKIEEKENKLASGKKVTLLGGGTGLPTLVEGLKKYTNNINAVVTITDEGRSSGRLRTELNILPPGDIRNNLVALSDSEKLMHDLFQYRFEEGTLKGHSLGNLFLAGMTKITGNFQVAIMEVSRLLNIKGAVFPASLELAQICAELSDNTILQGEQEIVIKGEKLNMTNRKPIKRVFLNPENTTGNFAAVKSIKQADIIVIGPGSLITSVMPNLLIKDIQNAIAESNALKVYVCNIVTQPGQTENFTAFDHVNFIAEYIGTDNIDIAIVNNELPDDNLQEQCAGDNSYVVQNDSSKIRALGINVLEANLIEKTKERAVLWDKLYLLKHNSNKIANLIYDNKLINNV